MGRIGSPAIYRQDSIGIVSGDKSPGTPWRPINGAYLSCFLPKWFPESCSYKNRRDDLLFPAVCVEPG